MFNIGDKLDKHNYTQGAIWCNKNGCVINPATRIIEVIPELTVEEQKAEVRAVRDKLLQETDKYLIIDYPISAEEKEKYKKYRTYLRNYTENDEWYLQKPQTFIEFIESFNTNTTKTPILE